MSFNEVLKLLNVYYQKGASHIFDIFDASDCMWQITSPRSGPYFLVKEEIKIYLEGNSAKRNEPQFSLIAYRENFGKGSAMDIVGLRETEFGLTAFHDYFYIEKRNSKLKAVGLISKYTKRIADLEVGYLKEHIVYENEIDETTVEYDERHLWIGNLPDDCTKEELKEQFSNYYPLKVAFQKRHLRKFAFITFDSEDIVKRIIKDMPKIILHERFEILYRIPWDSDYDDNV